MPTTERKELEDLANCLGTPKTSRVLQLIELSNNGLLMQDLFSLLNAPKDKGTQDALKLLQESGLIEKRKGTNVKTIRATWQQERNKLPALIEINIDAGLRFGSRFFCKQNPVALFFEKIINKNGLSKEQQALSPCLDAIGKEIAARWEWQKLAVDFNTELLPAFAQNFESIGKELGNASLNKILIAKKGAAEGLEMLNQKTIEVMEEMKKEKKAGRLAFVASLKEEKTLSTHLDYVSHMLQRLLVEEFIQHYTRFYEYVAKEQAPAIDLDKINFIVSLLQEVESRLSKNALVFEIVSRLQNFNNLLSVAMEQRKTMVLLENKKVAEGN